MYKQIQWNHRIIIKIGVEMERAKIRWKMSIFLFNFRSIAQMNNIYNNFRFYTIMIELRPFFAILHTPFTWSMHAFSTYIDWNALELRSMLMLMLMLMRWWCLYGAHILMHKLGVLDVVTMFSRISTQLNRTQLDFVGWYAFLLFTKEDDSFAFCFVTFCVCVH